jgi:hypothetical protein
VSGNPAGGYLGGGDGEVRVITEVKSRAQFQHVSTLRSEESVILLDAGRWDGAYYLAGYAVECALKSCIIKRLLESEAYPLREEMNRFYQHKLDDLHKLAGLEDEMKGSGSVAIRWQIVKDWSEQSRYAFGRDETEARDFIAAIVDPSEGVLPWLRLRW